MTSIDVESCFYLVSKCLQLYLIHPHRVAKTLYLRNVCEVRVKHFMFTTPLENTDLLFIGYWMLDGAVVMSSANRLVGTGFASQYQLQPRTGY